MYITGTVGGNQLNGMLLIAINTLKQITFAFLEFYSSRALMNIIRVCIDNRYMMNIIVNKGRGIETLDCLQRIHGGGYNFFGGARGGGAMH